MDHTLSLVAKTFFIKMKAGFNASYTYASPRPYYQIQESQANVFSIARRGTTPAYGNLSLSFNYLPNMGKPNARSSTVIFASVSNILGRDNIFGYNFGRIHPENMVAIRQTSRRFVFVGAFLNFGTDRSEDVINRNL